MPGWKILHDAGLVGREDEGPKEVDSKMEDVAAEGKPQSEEKAEEPTEQVSSPNEAELRKTLVFDDDLARLGRLRDTQKLVRYQMNPRPDWGPLSKAKAQ